VPSHLSLLFLDSASFASTLCAIHTYLLAYLLTHNCTAITAIESNRKEIRGWRPAS